MSSPYDDYRNSDGRTPPVKPQDDERRGAWATMLDEIEDEQRESAGEELS